MSRVERVRTSVAIAVFNRPSCTKRVLERIAQVRPKTLFVIADAPRPHVDTDREKCKAVQELIAGIDWCTDVRSICASTNMGCRRRLSSGVAAVFESVPEAIFLEDDCLPDPTFFRYCDELLERYRSDERVMSISGASFQYGWPTGDSYFGSRFAHVWGWASWQRAWRRYDESISGWPVIKRRLGIPWLTVPGYRDYWERIFDLVHAGQIDTWDFQWTFAHMAYGGIAISPTVNLVENIGFESDATHTVRVPVWLRQKGQAMDFPLQHPQELVWRDDCDARTFLCNNRLRPPLMPLRLPRWLDSIHKRLPGWRWRHQFCMRQFGGS